MRVFADLRAALAVFVATVLATAQMAGLVHRIAHPIADDSGAAVIVWASLSADSMCPHRHDLRRGQRLDDRKANAFGLLDAANHKDKGANRHHCASYDAAALGNGPPLAIVAVAAARCERYVPNAAGAVLPTGLARLAYRSRAPPLA
jgi:hypothetical protein